MVQLLRASRQDKGVTLTPQETKAVVESLRMMATEVKQEAGEPKL